MSALGTIGVVRPGTPAYSSRKTYPDLGTNRAKALGILKKIENSTIQKGLVDEVNRAVNDFMDNGFAEEIFEQSEPESVHYLRHFIGSSSVEPQRN